MLDRGEYLDGAFPSAQRFIVATEGPGTIRLEFLFTDSKYSGELTEVTWYEPGCGAEYRYQTAADENIFERADGNGLLILEQAVQSPGDHLVEFFSDSVTEYLLRISVIDG